MSNLFFLLGILLVTFLAIGTAQGSLEYLKSKMKDPFVNWLNISIPYGRDIRSTVRMLNDDQSAQEKFHYRGVSPFALLELEIYEKESLKARWIKGRTIEDGDELLGEILLPKNKITGNSFTENHFGLIITIGALKKLGYSEHDLPLPLIQHKFDDPLTQDGYRQLPIPVVAVVKDLPGLVDFLCTPFFYKNRIEPTSVPRPFDVSQAPGVEILIFDQGDKAVKAMNTIEEFFRNTHSFSFADPILFGPDSFNLTCVPGFLIRIGLLPDDELFIRDSLFQILKSQPEIRKYQPERYYDYKFESRNLQIDQLDKLTLKFDDYEQIDEFTHFLSGETYKLEIDMSQRESAKNYFYISSLTKILSFSLIIFSILSICLFLSNILKDHLEKMRMNIGTFMAFGLDNHSLERIYLIIIYVFILTSLIASFLVAWGIGSIGGVREIFLIFGGATEKGETYFDLFNWWTVSAILTILVTSYVSMIYITRRIFLQTPGDLIFERDGNC